MASGAVDVSTRARALSGTWPPAALSGTWVLTAAWPPAVPAAPWPLAVTEWRLAARGGAQANVLQILQAILELRFDFQHDPILIRLREDGRDLALAKGVIQRIVDRLRANTEARRRIAVDDQARLQAQVLVVAGNITELRQLLQLLHKARRPEAQLGGIGDLRGCTDTACG